MKRILIISGFLFFGTLLSAQNQSTPGINARQRNQHVRIAEGARSGDLSGKETRELQMQQRHLNRTKRQAKADGVVTPAEKATINRKQNRASRNIAVEKRD